MQRPHSSGNSEATVLQAFRSALPPPAGERSQSIRSRQEWPPLVFVSSTASVQVSLAQGPDETGGGLGGGGGGGGAWIDDRQSSPAL
eukprot:scaffold123598_cov31-Tisochrysis_lutea.AAC.1